MVPDTTSMLAAPPSSAVADYAKEACADSGTIDEKYENPTWGQIIKFGEDGQRELRQIEPPDELATYHTAVILFNQTLLAIMKEKDKNSLFNSFEFFVDPRFIASLENRDNEMDALPLPTQEFLADAGCEGENTGTREEDPTQTPEELEVYTLGTPITLRASQLDQLWGEPTLRGQLTLTFTSATRTSVFEEQICGTGEVKAQGTFLAIFYTATNEATSRIQPATQVNDTFVLIDNRGRQWEADGASRHCFIEANFAKRVGGQGPETMVGPGFSGTTAIVFDVPIDASGLQLRSGEFGFQVMLDR